uniref:Capsid scaffolding protein n=1 Tax=Bovine herpesvirus 4 TaxID=10385 RepID=A0A0F6N4Q6_BHV4|nr:capsid protein [Bovine gammaherpesvirus 4]QJC19164.1 capsid protein [Bovine gammaherpesvirus 4]
MAPTIIVAGFVDVLSYPKLDKSLFIDPALVSKYLPSPKPIPLNIEHISEAIVGWTLGLFKVTHGIFCVGAVTSQDFMSLLERMFPYSEAAQTHKKSLPHNPILQMLHTWLPSLSLSSLHPDHTPPPEANEMFQHVALCALGKRRGTVAVYGPDITWAVSKFNSLTESEVKHILNQCQGVRLEDLPDTDFHISSDILTAKAIDASYIKERLELLRTDKGVASVRQPTYLKASEYPTAPKLDISSRGDTMAQVPQTPDELITVPKSTFMSMLQSNLDNLKQTATKGVHGLPMYPAPLLPPHILQSHGEHQLGLYGPNMYSAYGYTDPPPRQYQDQLIPPNGMYFSGPQYYPRPPKRKREQEYTEGPLFPGEESTLYRDVLTLTRNISDLQSEIKDLKSMHAPSCHDQGRCFSHHFGLSYGPREPPRELPTAHRNSHQSSAAATSNHPPPDRSNTPPPQQDQSPISPKPPRPQPSVTLSPQPPQPPPERPPTHPVEASLRPDTSTTLQKMFCEELLNNQ